MLVYARLVKDTAVAGSDIVKALLITKTAAAEEPTVFDYATEKLLEWLLKECESVSLGWDESGYWIRAKWWGREYIIDSQPTVGAAVFKMIGKIEGVLNDERKRKKERLSRGVQLSQEA